MKPTLHALTIEQRARITALIASHPGSADLIRALDRDLDIGEVVNILGEKNSPYADAALELVSESVVSFDGYPIVSEGEGGAQVMAWVWVSDEQAGVDPDEEEGEGE